MGEALTQLRLHLFGHFHVERGGEEIQLSTRKFERLLAYLVLHPGSHSREKLAAQFWPDVPDDSARASLRNALSTLRRQLDPDLLQSDRQTVQINTDYPLWVDALAFQHQANRFLSSPSPAFTDIDLELYAGDLLADYYDDWVLWAQESFRDLYLDTLLELTQQMRSQSEYGKAIELAEKVLQIDRTHERAHQHLMFCYIALGDRGAALRQYETCFNTLQDELAVEPSLATKKLHDWIQQSPGERQSVEASLTNLPIPISRFVGRQREILAVKDRLSTTRLLTLTGAGGSGKTRLAIQVATDLLDTYPDGVWWVDLAALTDTDLVPRVAAQALAVPEVPGQTIIETLSNFLHAKELLLVLDNCEHLLKACVHFTVQLLDKCPQVKVLATSREALGIAGEYVWPVPTLSTPDPWPSSASDHLSQYESVRLFVERAAAVKPDFALTEETAESVADISRRLDGLPLAIELAAARANVLSTRQIAARLDDSFSILTKNSRTALPRHQTLRAAIDWSYKLLSEDERTLFRRLSVFSGSWTLAAAEKVCAGGKIQEAEIFDLLSRLVEKSLVEAHQRGEEAHFRMLETIRQYSRELLLESSDFTWARRNHLHYFLQLAEAAQPKLGLFMSDRDAAEWLVRLDASYDNLRAVLHWCVQEGKSDQKLAEAGLRLGTLLHWFWSARARLSEGYMWLTRLLQVDADVPLITQAEALVTVGYLACWQGDFAAGRIPLEEALILFQRLDDGPGVAFSLHGLGFVALGEGKTTLSRERFEQSLQKARNIDNRWVMSFALHFVAIVLAYQGEYQTASTYFEEGNELLKQLGGHTQALAFSHFHMARIALLTGDYEEAWSRHAQGIQLFQQLGDRRGIGYSLSGFAVLAAAQGELERATQLSGAVATLESLLGSFLEAPLQFEYERELDAVRESLDEETYVAFWNKGRAMTTEQAIDYALEQISDSP